MPRQSLKVLLIEDSPEMAEMLEDGFASLQERAFELNWAQTLKEGLALLRARRFDVTLLDLSLPDSLGLDTYREVRRAAPGMPVVILTGSDDEQLGLSAVREGAQDYLVKGTLATKVLGRVLRYAIERKRAEETLRDREEFFRLISESMTDLIAVIDRQGRRLYNSPSYRRLLGDPAASKGSVSFEEVHPDDRERIREIFLKTLETGEGQRAEYRFVTHDGTTRHVESQGSVIFDKQGRPEKVVVISRDITERKQAEEALRESEQRYRRLLQSTTDYIYSTTIDGGRVTSTTHSPGCETVTGYRPEDYAADPGLWLRMVHDDDKAAVLEQAEAVRAGQAAQPLEHRIRHKNGSIRWVRHTAVTRRDEQGRVIGADGLISDITARREAEERLRTSEALYHSLVECLPQNIFRKDAQGRFTFVNRQFCASLGRQPEEILGKTDFDFFPPELARKYQEDDRAIMASGKLFETVEAHRNVEGDRFVHVVKTPVYDVRGRCLGIQGIFWDITERKRAEAALKQKNEELVGSQQALMRALADLRRSHEELKATQLQLIQAEKMESIGGLAAGVAHEVKNPLQTILMGTRYLSKVLRDGDATIHQVLADMRDAVERADAIVKGLLEFSAPRELTLSREPLNDIVRRSLKMVNYAITDHHIDVTAELAGSLPALTLDRAKMEQVFINLFMNAIHAMPDGGRLTVRTSLRFLQSGEIAPEGRGAPEDPYRTGQMVVAAEVEDTGHGIPEDKLTKIFDPFFTTKPVGKGTGLGLTVVKKIVELNGGVIDIRNRREGGVRVTILFKPLRKGAS